MGCGRRLSTNFHHTDFSLQFRCNEFEELIAAICANKSKLHCGESMALCVDLNKSGYTDFTAPEDRYVLYSTTETAIKYTIFCTNIHLVLTSWNVMRFFFCQVCFLVSASFFTLFTRQIKS